MSSESELEEITNSFPDANANIVNNSFFYREKGNEFLQNQMEKIRKNPKIIDKRTCLHETTLVTAIKLHAIPEISELLKLGANVNLSDFAGKFPIHLVSVLDMDQPDNLNLFNLIINQPKIELDAKTRTGQTALHLLKSRKCIKKLITKKCALNEKDCKLKTPLCHHLDNTLIVKLLIENGATVDEEAIHQSVELKNEQLVAYLLNNCVKTNAINGTLLWWFTDNNLTLSMKNIIWNFVDPVYALDFLDETSDEHGIIEKIYEKWDEIYDKRDGDIWNVFIERLFKSAIHKFYKSYIILNYFFRSHSKFDLKTLLNQFFQTTKYKFLPTLFHELNKSIDRPQSIYEQIITVYLNQNFKLTFTDLNCIFCELRDCPLLRKLIRNSEFVEDTKLDFVFVSVLFNLSLTATDLENVLRTIYRQYNIYEFCLLSKYLTWPRYTFKKVIQKFSMLEKCSVNYRSLDLTDMKIIYEQQNRPKSLLELCRDQSRAYLTRVYNVRQPYQLCSVMTQIGIPAGIQDIILFERIIYTDIQAGPN